MKAPLCGEHAGGVFCFALGWLKWTAKTPSRRGWSLLHWAVGGNDSKYLATPCFVVTRWSRIREKESQLFFEIPRHVSAVCVLIGLECEAR